MEELQTKFLRLTTEEKKIFFDQISKANLGAKDMYASDTEDEDWFPFRGDESQDSSETSDDDHSDSESQDSESEEDNEARTNERKAGTKLSESAKALLASSSKKLSNDNRTVLRENNLQKAPPAKHLSVTEAFQKIFSKEMVDIIVRCTNRKATMTYRMFNEWKAFEKQLLWKDLTSREFYAFLGMLLLAGLNKSNTDESCEMWRKSAHPLYRATMSHNRFRSILRFIEFDEANTRAERTSCDRAAPIRDIWTIFNSNLSRAYQPVARAPIVDEQFFPCKDRTGFTHYIPSKKPKHGIVVWWMRDPVSGYPINGQIYTGDSSPSLRTANVNKEEKDSYNEQHIIGRLLELYTARRRTKRWPLAFFYNILDVCNLAACILYHRTNRMMKSKHKRRSYVRKLSEELCMPLIKGRARDLRVMRDYETRIAIEGIFKKTPNPVNNIPIVSRKTLKLREENLVDSCHICCQDALKTRRRAEKFCAGCDKAVCAEHVNIIKCKDCNE